VAAILRVVAEITGSGHEQHGFSHEQHSKGGNIERRWPELAWRPSPHHAWLADQLRPAAATARMGKLSKRSDRSRPIRPERSVRSL
jgi:hypothetical protein